MFGLDGLSNLVKGLIKIADRRRGRVDDAVARARPRSNGLLGQTPLALAGDHDRIC